MAITLLTGLILIHVANHNILLFEAAYGTDVDLKKITVLETDNCCLTTLVEVYVNNTGPVDIEVDQLIWSLSLNGKYVGATLITLNLRIPPMSAYLSSYALRTNCTQAIQDAYHSMNRRWSVEGYLRIRLPLVYTIRYFSLSYSGL